jgi:hypothetical protein
VVKAVLVVNTAAAIPVAVKTTPVSARIVDLMSMTNRIQYSVL